MLHKWDLGEEQRQSVGFHVVTEADGMAAVDRNKLDRLSDDVEGLSVSIPCQLLSSAIISGIM